MGEYHTPLETTDRTVELGIKIWGGQSCQCTTQMRAKGQKCVLCINMMQVCLPQTLYIYGSIPIPKSISKLRIKHLGEGDETPLLLQVHTDTKKIKFYDPHDVLTGTHEDKVKRIVRSI